MPWVCPIEYTCEGVGGPRTDICDVVEEYTKSGFDVSSGTLTFSSIDMIGFVPGAYEIMITAISATKSDSFTIDVYLVEPCPTVDLNPLDGAINDQSYTLG